MSDTPRTDEALKYTEGYFRSTAYANGFQGHAQTLERDINELNELNERLIDRQKTLMATLVENQNLKTQAAKQRPHCDWKQDEDGNWDTSCGRCMCFEHAPPFEQGYKFCHHCGSTINFIEFTWDDLDPPEPPFEDFGGME